MREIVFRGKRTDDEGWVEGSFCPKNSRGDIPCIIVYNGRMAGHWFEVNPATVGQYTGLTDKNGKKIFEGDIVRCGTGRICKVTFFTSPSFSGFDLVAIGGFDSPPPHNWDLFADTEVIGNIHDNNETWCDMNSRDRGEWFSWHDDDFCSYGERRNDV